MITFILGFIAAIVVAILLGRHRPGAVHHPDSSAEGTTSSLTELPNRLIFKDGRCAVDYCSRFLDTEVRPYKTTVAIVESSRFLASSLQWVSVECAMNGKPKVYGTLAFHRHQLEPGDLVSVLFLEKIQELGKSGLAWPSIVTAKLKPEYDTTTETWEVCEGITPLSAASNQEFKTQVITAWAEVLILVARQLKHPQ